MITGVRAPLLVRLLQRQDFVEAKESGVLRSGAVQCFEQQRTQRSTEPFVCGDIETDLLARQNRSRKFVPHQVLQNHFLARAIDLSDGGSEAANSTMR